jgi:hypothetical protein
LSSRNCSPPQFFNVERRVGEDVVCFQIRETVVEERIALLDTAVDPVEGEIHLAPPPGRVVELLAVDADVTDTPAVGFDELLGLDKHAAGAAARVVEPPLVWAEHFHKEFHDAARCVELSALLSFGARELSEEVLVDSTEDVPGAHLNANWQAGSQ